MLDEDELLLLDDADEVADGVVDVLKLAEPDADAENELELDELELEDALEVALAVVLELELAV